ESDDVDRLCCFDLNLRDLVRLNQRVAVRLILIAFRDLIVAHDLPALLTALVIADRAKVFAVQLIELNFFGRFDRVINANRNRDEQKTYVTLPNRSHRDPPLEPTSCRRWRAACPPFFIRSLPLAVL